MKSSIGSTAALALAVGLVVVPAAAQLNSIPVYFNPKGGTGFTLGVDFGKGINNESGKNTAFAARAYVGGGPITIGAGVGTSRLKPSFGASRETELQYMGTLGLRVFGGPLLPVSIGIQGGVGYINTEIPSGTGVVDSTTLSIPIGIGIGFSAPTPGFSFDPWIAPRVSISRVEIGTTSNTQAGFGVSGGVNLAFVMGLGLHVGFDWTKLPRKTSGLNLAEVSPATIGVGVHYTFGPPGIPVVPGA